METLLTEAYDNPSNGFNNSRITAKHIFNMNETVQFSVCSHILASWLENLKIKEAISYAFGASQNVKNVWETKVNWTLKRIILNRYIKKKISKTM